MHGLRTHQTENINLSYQGNLLRVNFIMSSKLIDVQVRRLYDLILPSALGAVDLLDFVFIFYARGQLVARSCGMHTHDETLVRAFR